MVAQICGQPNFMFNRMVNPFSFCACQQYYLQQQMQQMLMFRNIQQQQMQRAYMMRAAQQQMLMRNQVAYNYYPQLYTNNFLNNNLINIQKPISTAKPVSETETEEENIESSTQKSKRAANVTEQKLTPQVKQQIISGTYSAPYVKVNGITHYRYADCDANKLVNVGNGKLHKDAAAAFKKMAAEAAKDGINLTAYSPLRTKSTQIANFSNKMKTKGRSFEENLKWSAPGGFSEHHTGYALDINCASNSFANTKEYKWLKQHAAEYGFELSFPKNNCQGIGFEPWHWRFVGTDEAKRTFADARAAAKANGQKIID